MAIIKYSLNDFFSRINVDDRKLTRQIAFEYLDGVVRLSPVDTGFFRGRWRVTFKNIGKNRLEATLLNDAIYASFLEPAVSGKPGISSQAPNGMIRPVDKTLSNKYKRGGNNQKFTPGDRSKQFKKNVIPENDLRRIALKKTSLKEFLAGQAGRRTNLTVLLAATNSNVKPPTMLTFLKLTIRLKSRQEAVEELEDLIANGITEVKLLAVIQKLLRSRRPLTPKSRPRK